jgi:branched-subunit amino acid aminotransferase/4-amino-4-deoxychorismate lyase
MHAWTKDGNPAEHPEPWGLHGAFTTLRRFACGHLPFREDYLDRLLDSANRIGANWIPSKKELSDRLEEFLAGQSESFDGLIRICLFDGLLGISSRLALSDGNPVTGRLLEYRRPVPLAKSTGEARLYGRLGELDVATEDWLLLDPEEGDLRESATSNLIFAQGKDLLIPDKFILQGIVLNKLIPILQAEYSVSRGSPQENDIPEFDEIILCGTGRGVAPLTALPELGWTSRNNQVFQKARSQYQELVQP